MLRTNPALLAALALWLPATSACTLAPGGWFATLEPTFEARFTELTDRDAGGGWQRLNTSYAAKLTRAVLTFEEIELVAFGAGPGSFDPSNPPRGYSLCHNGHCHHDDGRLVPYEEIEAELAGGGGGARVVVSLPAGEVDLLAPSRLELGCEPSCDLPLVHIQRSRATLLGVVFEGLVRDEQVPPRLSGEVPWRWVEAGTGTATPLMVLDGELDLPADRKHPPDVALELSLEVTARVLDHLDWSALSGAGFLDLSDAANEAGREQLRENLAETELTAAVQRSN